MIKANSKNFKQISSMLGRHGDDVRLHNLLLHIHTLLGRAFHPSAVENGTFNLVQEIEQQGTGIFLIRGFHNLEKRVKLDPVTVQVKGHSVLQPALHQTKNKSQSHHGPRITLIAINSLTNGHAMEQNLDNKKSRKVESN